MGKITYKIDRLFSASNILELGLKTGVKLKIVTHDNAAQDEFFKNQLNVTSLLSYEATSIPVTFSNTGENRFQLQCIWFLSVILFPDTENYGNAYCHNNCSADPDAEIPVCCLILRNGDVECHDVACQIRLKVAVTLFGKDQYLVVSGHQISRNLECGYA